MNYYHKTVFLNILLSILTTIKIWKHKIFHLIILSIPLIDMLYKNSCVPNILMKGVMYAITNNYA